MKTSIIMPCWITNEELLGLTAQTIHVLRQTEEMGNTEMIVIDNGSPLGGDFLQQVSDICIRNRENLGYPPAVNQGLKLAKGDLICVANNDVRPSPNWLKVARTIFEKIPQAGSVHYRMIDYEAPMELGDEVWDHGKERWCTSSFFVLKREVIEKIGYYDENFRVFGYEDWDWWTRVRKAGFKTCYTNGAVYQHKDSSTADLLDQENRQTHVEKNREYFKQKWGEYPEEIFKRMYPTQMLMKWKPFP